MQSRTLACLLEQPSEYEFVQSVRILRYQAKFSGVKATLKFKAWIQSESRLGTEVYSIERINKYTWVVHCSQGALTGPYGVIPNYLHREVLTQKIAYGEQALADFIGIFNQRYYELLYKSEIKYNVPLQREEQQLDLNKRKAYIFGLLSALSGGHQYSSLPRKNLIQYTGLIGLKTNSLETLKQLLEDYFDYPFKVSTQDPEYVPLLPCCITKLGVSSGQNQQLGHGAMAGRKAALCFQRVLVIACPKSQTEYEKIYSDKNIFTAVYDLARNYIADDVEINIYIETPAHYLQSALLSSQKLKASYLGSACYLSHLVNKQKKVLSRLKANTQRYSADET